MKRREFSLSAASAVAASALTLPVATPALAQARQFKEGKDFRRLDKPVAPDAPAGKVDVIEFFWYSCPHCNAFEPALDAWVKAAPKDLSVRRMPVAFNASFVPQQKLYYALEGMGKLEAQGWLEARPQSGFYARTPEALPPRACQTCDDESPGEVTMSERVAQVMRASSVLTTRSTRPSV